MTLLGAAQIRELAAALDLKPSKSLGQNFVIDSNVCTKIVPINQLLVETDSPFLSPMPHRGALNTPAQIANIVRAMAVERNADLGELASALGDNAERLFGSFAS